MKLTKTLEKVLNGAVEHGVIKKYINCTRGIKIYIDQYNSQQIMNKNDLITTLVELSNKDE